MITDKILEPQQILLHRLVIRTKSGAISVKMKLKRENIEKSNEKKIAKMIRRAERKTKRNMIMEPNRRNRT